MSDNSKPKRIIGKRIRVVIGEEVPKKDEDNSTVVGEDTLVHVRPEELEEGTQVVGEQVTLVIGDPRPVELIKAMMTRAQELNLPNRKRIIALGQSALSAQDKPAFKERLSVFIKECKNLAPFAMLVIELVKIYSGL